MKTSIAGHNTDANPLYNIKICLYSIKCQYRLQITCKYNVKIKERLVLLSKLRLFFLRQKWNVTTHPAAFLPKPTFCELGLFHWRDCGSFRPPISYRWGPYVGSICELAGSAWSSEVVAGSPMNWDTSTQRPDCCQDIQGRDR